MTYFAIRDLDCSQYVRSLKVKTQDIYNSQTNARGNTVVDYIASKKIVEVEIIPLDDTTMAQILTAIKDFGLAISYREPQTNKLKTNMVCIVGDKDVEFYTIRADKIMYKALKLKFTEL